MKTYCTQNDGNCKTCSLVNYGMDCQNNPITQPKPAKRLRGRAAAEAAYDGHHGPVTMSAVEAQIPDELRNRLTGYEYGLVMSAVNAAYHNGRASHGGLDLCDDCVWLPWGGEIKTECGACNTDDPDKCKCVDKIGMETGQLIPIAALRHIKIDNSEPNKRRYTMDYTESY